MASNGDDILNIMDWCRKISPFHRSLPEVSMIISIKTPTTSRHLACWIIFQYSMSPREKKTCGIISLHNFWNRFVTYYFSRNPPFKHLRWFRRCLSTCQVALVRGPPKRQDKNWKENPPEPFSSGRKIPMLYQLVTHIFLASCESYIWYACRNYIGSVHLCLPMVGWGGVLARPKTWVFAVPWWTKKNRKSKRMFWDLIPIHGEGSLMMGLLFRSSSSFTNKKNPELKRKSFWLLTTCLKGLGCGDVAMYLG